MRRKVILDVDPGIDDAVAVAIALFDPRLEVLALTATGGNVAPEQATANLQAIVSLLDPPRLPRLGAAPSDVPMAERFPSVHGPDGLGGADLPRVDLHGGHAAEKVIHETFRAHPHEVTFLALGPLTNLSRVLSRDPSVAECIGEVVISGGTHEARGTATPVADFNLFADATAARHVIREPLTKTLVPLETTASVGFGFDLLDQLPPEATRTGFMLRNLLPPLFRASRQVLGLEGAYLHDVVTLMSLVHPELFERTSVAADVETQGELTTGMVVLDRRHQRLWKPTADMLVSCEAEGVRDAILRGIATAARGDR
jgi:purine nucleosidase